MIFWTVTILGVYLLIILAIGFHSGRGGEKNTKSFFVANRHLNWLQEAMAVFTTLAPAGALLGTIGLFYKDSGVLLGYVFGFTLIKPVAYWYVGSRLRRLGKARGYQTQAVFIGEFYQSSYLRWAVALAGVIFSIPMLATNPIAVGELLHQFANVPYFVGVLIFIVVAGVYTFKGGLRAVANTDVFHGFLLLAFLVAAVVVLVIHAGGLLHVLDSPKALVPTSGHGRLLFFAWIPYTGLVTICQPDRAFRMFAVRDDQNLQKAVVISGAMSGLAAFSYLLIGLSVRSLLPAIEHTDTTLASGLQLVAVWLIPWFVMNAWGGSMSTFTGGLLSTSNILIKDIFEPWYVRHNVTPGPKRDRLMLIAARVCILCLVLCTVVVSFYPPSFIWILIHLNIGALIQFAPLLILAFLWRGVTRLGAQLGFTAGLVSMVLWSFVFKPPFGIFAGLDALAVNTVVMVAISLLSPDKQELRDQREELRRLASIEDEKPITPVAIPVRAT